MIKKNTSTKKIHEILRKISIDSKKTDDKKDKKVIIVHGWDEDITKGWFPWLKSTLENQGFKVLMEQMPDSNAPKIEVWTEVLKDISGDVDEKTYFVGHSIGCQTIIRMLEKHESKKVGGAIFLAGWFHLKDFTYKEEPKLEKLKRQIAEPWINNTIDFSKVQSRFDPGTITAIFSDNDPYVDIINAEIFKQKLGARILVESGKGHYSEEEIDVLPIIVQEMLRISKEK